MAVLRGRDGCGNPPCQPIRAGGFVQRGRRRLDSRAAAGNSEGSRRPGEGDVMAEQKERVYTDAEVAEQLRVQGLEG